jgi:hypothetical protein
MRKSGINSRGFILNFHPPAGIDLICPRETDNAIKGSGTVSQLILPGNSTLSP